MESGVKWNWGNAKSVASRRVACAKSSPIPGVIPAPPETVYTKYLPSARINFSIPAENSQFLDKPSKLGSQPEALYLTRHNGTSHIQVAG